MGPLTPTLIAAALLALAPPAPPVPDAEVEARLRRDVTYMAAPVSYTHLTLPTN